MTLRQKYGIALYESVHMRLECIVAPLAFAWGGTLYSGECCGVKEPFAGENPRWLMGALVEARVIPSNGHRPRLARRIRRQNHDNPAKRFL